MKSFGIIAASSLFGALVNAAPLNKRDIFWVTETDMNIVTIPVTQTVWVSYEEAFAHYPHTRSAVTSTVVVPASTTSTSVYVAPSTTSTSVYVAPTTTSTSEYVAPVATSTSEYVAPTTSSTSVYVAPTTSSTSEYVTPTTTSTSEYIAPTTTSTSVYVAPTTSSTSTSVYVAPTTTEAPTSTYVAPSTTSSSAAAATTTSASSGSGVAATGTEYTGDMTWYDVGLGACGWTNVPTDHIVAISEVIYDNAQYATANPNNNPLCGRYVSITGVDGTAYTAEVVDRCTGCAEADLDLSEDFFNIVTSNGNGRVHDISWVWL